jgi:hypothetical protein
MFLDDSTRLAFIRISSPAMIRGPLQLNLPRLPSGWVLPWTAFYQASS